MTSLTAAEDTNEHKVFLAPPVANLSASFFPGILLCPGIHTKSVLKLELLSAENVSQGALNFDSDGFLLTLVSIVPLS
jgi:hypothetical protein